MNIKIWTIKEIHKSNNKNKWFYGIVKYKSSYIMSEIYPKLGFCPLNNEDLKDRGITNKIVRDVILK